uniref:phasin family protein n=1 Tax=Pararhizobium sp. IMCC3301 TaxID=3067904 RepID=UPI0027411938|nr:phasin family protein [Pararhizobium sp. IMCC3301]
MSKKYDMTEQMRAFAEQGMDQARKAFDTYMETMQETVSKLESSSTDLKSKTSEASKKAISITEAHMNAAFSQAEKLVTAKDPQEALELQTKYIREQIDALTKQAQSMGEEAVNAVKDIQDKFKA